MVYDLGLAMRRKEEFETARLVEFEFRLRARAARLLAFSTGVGEAAAAGLVATVPEGELVARFAEIAATPVDVIQPEYQRCLTEARVQLVAERGDPSPHCLA